MIFADFHIHSHYSRATSSEMNPQQLTKYALKKGLNLLGTGDITHPVYLKELKAELEEDGSGILRNKDGFAFVLQGEVSLIYKDGGKGRKVHLLVLSKDFATVDQINDWLDKRKLRRDYDGRPIFGMSAPEFVENVMQISKDNLIIPAHIWTPWFGLLGSESGFDSLDECFKDQTRHIRAIETGLSCYDEKTEVLTENGWKKFSEVEYDDRICTLNPISEEIEFQYPQKIFIYNYKGKMYRLKTKRVDLLVTPNHKILYRPCDFRTKKPFRLEEAQYCIGKSKILKKNGSWEGENKYIFILPAVKIRHGSRFYSGLRDKLEKRIPMKEWLKFFGFWTAEGWTTGGREGDYRVCVSNTNPKLIAEMKKLLKSFGYNPFYDNKTHTLRVRDYQLYSYLKQFGKAGDKYIPSDIKNLSKDLLKILLEYYVKGDGHIYGRSNKGLSATTSSIRLRDDLQEIALKMGMSAYYKRDKKKGTPFGIQYREKVYYQNNDTWVIYFVRRNEHTILPSLVKNNKQIERWIKFKGKVYCVSVPNKVVYVRRNGIPVWCGNSDPAMNWRVPFLDDITVISNSDPHSPWPWRLGRECNAFDCKLDYDEIINAIRRQDKKKLKFTIETPPEYGKYHWSGHRNCGIVAEPEKAKKLNFICPSCKQPMTKGVEDRLNELATREHGYKADRIPFYSFVPLSEVIAGANGITNPGSKKVYEIYNRLVGDSSEFEILIDAPLDRIEKLSGEKVADIVRRMREGKLKVKPGYDGVYGEMIIEKEQKTQRTLDKF